MKLQPVLIALTLVNAALLTGILVRPQPSQAQAVNGVLRGKALEIVDDKGKVRASITIFPADPKVKMPDGSTGYPETVLFRLISPEGKPNVKIQATTIGGGLGFSGSNDPSYVQLGFLPAAGGPQLKMTSQSGREQIVKP
jgi:hypothetical protein